MQYTYHVNFDERGGFYADVRDPQGVTVFEVRGGNELPDDETSLVDDGYMKHLRDINGLLEYLIQAGILPKQATLIMG